MIEAEGKMKLQRISNVEKNFIYECEICFEDYDTVKHIPMIVCSNYHAICAKCVKSNLFKQEYNAIKIPTGRYMCSKCSQIIDKTFIREHTILKEVCSYIKTIREKDEQLKKEFYNHVGTMGMNLVAMREDFDAIEKNNVLLKKENENLIKENYQLREQFIEIEKVKGSFEELQKVAKQVEEMKEALDFERAKLESLKYEAEKKNQEILEKKNDVLKENQKFFHLQGELTSLKEDIKAASKKSKELLEQNEGAINLREYLEQEINNLQNEKKKILQENDSKKRKINESLKLMQKYWENALKGEDKLEDIPFKMENPKSEEKIKEIKNELPKIEEKQNQLSQQSSYKKLEVKHQIQQKDEEKINFLFDESEKTSRNFMIDNMTATLIYTNLSQFVHISFEDGFNLQENSEFTIKIRKLQTNQIIIGLMTSECKNKRKVYERKGFYGIDGFENSWVDGNNDKCAFKIKQGDEIKVQYVKETHSITFSKPGRKETIKLPQPIKNKSLYPVVLMISDGDEFEVLEVK